MDLGEIEKIMKLMQSHGFHQLEIEEENRKIKLVQNALPTAQPLPAPGFLPSFPLHHNPIAAASHHPSAGPAQAEKPQSGAKDKSKYKEVRSPFVGTFYAAPNPGADDFVSPGKRVKKGDTLCIVEAMKMMNEIEAEKDMVIVEVLIANESPVEFDQPLFLYE